jgi:hypothetical protein
MKPPIDTDLLIETARDLLVAEAEYRSAMNIYKDHPIHRTRIRAECRWHWAKNNMKAVLDGASRADEVAG